MERLDKTLEKHQMRFLQSSRGILNWNKLRREEGSIAVFVTALFLIALILSMGLVNISDAYIAKRELIQIAEEIAQKSAHSVDYSRYYLDAYNWEGHNRTPLDCLAAKLLVSQSLLSARLRDRKVELDSISCEADFLQLKVHSTISPVIDFFIFRAIIGHEENIEASVEATTILGK